MTDTTEVERHPLFGTDVVRATDYDALAARIEELEENLRLRTAERNYANDVVNTYVEQVKELEAKRVKAVNFIVFLDENYRHAFGVTARQKIRELYVELKGEKDD